MPWTEIYRPKRFNEVKGQADALDKLRRFVMSFGNSGVSGSRGVKGKKAMIFYGPPGTGKTTLVHVAAFETDSEIFEINASDLRNKNKLREILKPAMEQMSLTSSRKMILVDEVDGISKFDFGGLTELINLVDKSHWPVIITANDIWDKRFGPLRKKAEVVQFKEVDYRTVKDVLISILRRENKFLSNDVLTGIAVKAKGDLRAAINDLQIASEMENPSDILENERNHETDIFNAMRTVFKEKPNENVLRLFDSVNMPLDQISLWLEENIPIEYHGKELCKAYDALSRADVFKGRIYKQQYWRFMVYENILLSYGISAAKEGVKTGFTSYKKPDRILKIWMNNQRTAKKKSISKKFAERVHAGEKRIMFDFPLLRFILRDPKIRGELRLEPDEIEYLNKLDY